MLTLFLTRLAPVVTSIPLDAFERPQRFDSRYPSDRSVRKASPALRRLLSVDVRELTAECIRVCWPGPSIEQIANAAAHDLDRDARTLRRILTEEPKRIDGAVALRAIGFVLESDKATEIPPLAEFLEEIGKRQR